MLTQETLDRIRRIRGGHYPVLSVYLNVHPVKDDPESVRTRLRHVLEPVEEALEHLPHEEAESLRADIEAVLDLNKRIVTDLGRSIAVFACNGIGLFEYIVLPRPVWDNAIADASAYTRPLMAVLDEFHRTCAVVVDRQRATFYEFFVDQLESCEESVTEGERKSNFGGWYGLAEYRTRRRAEETTHRHYRETAKFLEDLHATRRFDLIVIGGHESTVEELIPFLAPHIRRLVAGTFVIDPNTATSAIVHDHVKRLERTYERELERSLVAEARDAEHTGAGVFGLEAVLRAAVEHSIGLLLIEDGASDPGVACDACGWLGTTGDRCPACDAELRPAPEVIDDLAELVVDTGGVVNHVSGEEGLGGVPVAAIRRYPPAAAQR